MKSIRVFLSAFTFALAIGVAFAFNAPLADDITTTGYQGTFGSCDSGSPTVGTERCDLEETSGNVCHIASNNADAKKPGCSTFLYQDDDN